MDDILKHSDFKTASKKKNGDYEPLALQNGFSGDLTYIQNKWNPEIFIPYIDHNKLEDRILPGTDIKHPYLTVSDFLEPYLIEVPFYIDNKHFWTGLRERFDEGDRMLGDPPDNSYLLPIKSFYFEFFNLEDLKGKIGSKPVFRMIKTGMDGVRVELKVPIKSSSDKKFVCFERLYKPDVSPDESKNIGAIKKCIFNLGFLPFYSGESAIEQRVGFIDSDVLYGNRNSMYQLYFHKITDHRPRLIKEHYTTTRSDEAKDHGHNATSKYFIINEQYDYLEVVKEDLAKGLIIPQPRPVTIKNKRFTFAVNVEQDFTHIEYSINSAQDSRPFDITREDPQLITLSDRLWYIFDPQLEVLLTRELIPYRIGPSEKYKFPVRTVTSEIDSHNHLQATLVLADINIPFHYEKTSTLNSERIYGQLKWLPPNTLNKANKNRYEAFLETLFILIRNKVLLNGADLKTTRIIWFYSPRLKTYKLHYQKKDWDRLYKKYFDPDGETKAYARSQIGFYNDPTAEGLSLVHPVVNICIDKNSTDITVFQNKLATLSTTVSFGYETVFGDGYTEGEAANNGFVKVFKPVAETFLNNNRLNLNELYYRFRQLIQTDSVGSIELMEFFFSLEKNEEIAEKNLEFRFRETVSDHHEFNIVFLVYFGALFYHVAKLVKGIGLKMPSAVMIHEKSIKITRLLDPSSEVEGVRDFCRRIFGYVYSDEATSARLRMLQTGEWHESICRGGIFKSYRRQKQEKYDKIVLMGDDSDTLINAKPVHFKRSPFTYGELSNKHEDAVISEIKRFIDILFGLHHVMDFEDHFGIDPSKLPFYKTALQRDLKANLSLGLEERLKKTADENKNLEESLFFYPLVASIYELTREIAGG